MRGRKSAGHRNRPGGLESGTTAWIAGHVDALRIGGYALAAAVVWFAELSWFTFFLLAAALAAYQIVLARLATPDDTSTPTPA